MKPLNYMKLAMEEALLTSEDVPIGAVIVKNSTVISKAHNLTICDIDPTAHAEILAIRLACKSLSSRILSDCDMYVTLEPCAMCAQAISLARMRRVYFGAYNRKLGGIENGAQIFRYCTHIPEVYGGFFEEENSEVLKKFFQNLREPVL